MTIARFIPYKRKRTGKTNYRKRLALLKGRKSRLVVRVTNKNVISQLVDFDKKGDRVLAQVNSRELLKHGWKFSRKNLPAAYLTGFLLGKKASAKVKEAVLDSGLHTSVKGSRVYACLKGVLDAGINVPHDPEILPTPERLSGKHIKDGVKIVELFNKIKSKL
jgi:large subunit ribosomal protein L18